MQINVTEAEIVHWNIPGIGLQRDILMRMV